MAMTSRGSPPTSALRAGLVRSFQITRLLFKSLTVQENMAFAVQAREGSGPLLPGAPGCMTDAPVECPGAGSVLDRMGLAASADARVEQLSHGEQRALEVGLTLAGRPRLVLLDEPMAGMGAEESERRWPR